MKYYSEVLKKVFDTVDALNEAESAILNKEQEKQRRTEELSAARKVAEEAEKKYFALLKAYRQDYGVYSYPASCSSDGPATLAKILEQIGIKLA